MQLILSPAFDNGIGLKSPHALGVRHVGPYGLVGLMEAELALPAPEASHTKNVMAYLQRLRDERHEGRFFWASMHDASAIRTAETLLRWRNALYEHGWDGSWAGDEARLADMAAVEALEAGKLQLGLGLRCRRIAERLEDFKTQLTQLTVLNREGLPPVLESLLQQLASMGVTIVADYTMAVHALGDLGAVQQSLLDASSDCDFAGDGSIEWHQAQSLQMAVRWVSEQLQAQPGQRIAIYAPDDVEALDDALGVAGLPMAGLTAGSSARPVLQLLPLTLQLLLEPLDPQVLLQFLTHPVGPLPYRLCSALASVVADKPGIGSAAWQQAIDDYFTGLAEDHPERAASQRKQLSEWLEINRYPGEAIPVLAINTQLQLLRRWLRGRESNLDHYAERQLYQQAIGQIDELDLAVAQLAGDKGSITADDLDDVMHQLRARGSQMNGRESQAGHVTVLTDAGSFVPELDAGVFDTVIWLGVQEQPARIWPWFQREQAALREQGVALPQHATLAERATVLARRVLLAARERVVLVQLQRDKAAHPLLEKLRNLLGDGFAPQALSRLMTDPVPTMVPVPAIQLPVMQRWWQLDAKAMSSDSVRWSYSRISQLLSSPHEYVFNYLAKIRNDDLLTLSDGALLKGSLVHLLVEDFFNAHVESWREPDDKALALWAREHLGRLIREQGAVLIQPGRHVEAEQFKDSAVVALQRLLGHLRSASVVKVEVEKKQQASFGGDEFIGYIDLLVTHTDGTETVIDMKWGGLSNRREEIRDNLAVQLATYGWLRRQDGAELWPDHGFYIIASTQLLMTNKHHFPLATEVRTEEDGSLAQLWRSVEISLDWRQQQLRAGEVEVPIPGIAQDRELEPPPGGLVFNDSVAPWSDYTHLTGWE